MIKIYKSLNFFPKKEVLYDNEGFFNNNISGRRLSGLSKKVMKKIDKAELIDVNLSTMQTPYGVCNIKYLSTGCKTVLNLIYIMEHRDKYNMIKAINATECGANALDVLFDVVEECNCNIGIVIEHTNELYNCRDRKYLIDDEREIDSLLWI